MTETSIPPALAYWQLADLANQIEQKITHSKDLAMFRRNRQKFIENATNVNTVKFALQWINQQFSNMLELPGGCYVGQRFSRDHYRPAHRLDALIKGMIQELDQKEIAQ